MDKKINLRIKKMITLLDYVCYFLCSLQTDLQSVFFLLLYIRTQKKQKLRASYIYYGMIWFYGHIEPALQSRFT
jgi:hypothetical protein